MNMNLDCFKDVLSYCVDNIDYTETSEGWMVYYVDLNMLYGTFSEAYERKDIMRTVLHLRDSNFITIHSCFPTDKPYLERCTIEDVTMKGYQFLEAIKDPTIWEKTKSVAGKVGNYTLSFITGVAHDVAVEAGKQAVTIMMNQ